ncbi:MAG: SanA/YdcF family protein [Saccharofermentanales bacterium]
MAERMAFRRIFRKKPAVLKKKPGRNKLFRKILRAVMTALVLLIMISVILTLAIDFYVSRLGRKNVREPGAISGDLDCIIVPGASVIGNSIPSAILQDRLDVAYNLYLSSGIDKIIVSGDHGTIFYDEVNVMRNYLISKGVPGEKIFMDHAGFDTYQTLYRARDVFEVKRAVIVTQDFHLYRALYIGKKLGLELYGVDSAIRQYGHDIYNRLREFPARAKAFIECEIVRPVPEFLGEKIPISGDNLTLD